MYVAGWPGGRLAGVGRFEPDFDESAAHQFQMPRIHHLICLLHVEYEHCRLPFGFVEAHGIHAIVLVIKVMFQLFKTSFGRKVAKHDFKSYARRLTPMSSCLTKLSNEYPQHSDEEPFNTLDINIARSIFVIVRTPSFG